MYLITFDGIFYNFYPINQIVLIIQDLCYCGLQIYESIQVNHFNLHCLLYQLWYWYDCLYLQNSMLDIILAHI